MKKISLALFIISCVFNFNALSQNKKKIIFPERPRVAMKKDALDKLRKDPAFEKKRLQIARRGDSLLKKGLLVPEKEGQWIFYYRCPKDGATLKFQNENEHQCPKCKKVYSDKRTKAAYQTSLYYRLDSEIHALALAFAVTGDNKYVEPVKTAFMKLIELYPKLERHDRWGRRGLLAVVGGRRFCSPLQESTSLVKLAKAYDLCADSSVFTDDDRKAVEQEFLGKVAREIQSFQIFVGLRNNFRAWFNAAYACVGMAIGDETLVNDAVYGSSGFLNLLKYSVTNDGIWYEGTMSYHFYALRAMIEMLKALEHADWTFKDNKRLKSLWLAPVNMAYPNGLIPATNDGDPFHLNKTAFYYDFACEYFNDPTFANFADKKKLEKNLLLKSTFLPDLGFAALREGRGENAICAMLDYGIHGEHHGHPDKLNLLIYALGKEWMPDPGRINYGVPEYETWGRTSIAHNTVIIDKRDQLPNTGKMVFFKETDSYSACYATAEPVEGFKFSRFLFLTENYLVDVFRVKGDRKAIVDWIIHVRGELKAVGSDKVTAVKQLGVNYGYQHLTDIKSYAKQPIYKFDSLQNDSKKIVTHLIGDTDSELYTGIGIGTRIDEKVPFVLRRRKIDSTDFIAVYDLSGTGDYIKKVVSKNESGAKSLGLELHSSKGILNLNYDYVDKLELSDKTPK